MKKFFVIAWVFALAFAMLAPSSLTASAASPGFENHVLKPSKDTEKVFEKVTLNKDGDMYRMSVKGYIKKGDHKAEGYHIHIDPKKMTYKATKISDEKVKKEEPTSDVSTPLTPLLSKTYSPLSVVSPMSTRVTYAKIKAVTDDPVGADLVWTIHQLTWNYDGTYAYKGATEGSCHYASPSTFGTYWYNDSCYYDNYSTIDGGRTVTVTAHGSYHNYDFGDNSLITKVTHKINIEGYGSGSAYYWVDWTRSGEHANYLDLDVYKY